MTDEAAVSDHFDTVVASDLRLPGGTSASLAEEVRAQAAAGYRTALVQVFGPLVAKPRPVHPALRACVEAGLAVLVPPAATTVRADLAVLRHPAVFHQVPAPAPRIIADQVVLVANQAARGTSGTRHYDPEHVDHVVEQWLGRRPLWAPIGPLVRPTLDGAAIRVRDRDWVNVIDVDEWTTDRDAYRDVVPVIGRHSRPQPAKWPSTREELLAVYPDDASVRVRVLGGAAAVEDVLGEVPASWEVEPFGARHPREFLADLDFFVYYHHRDWVEAFGRTVMEALASGAVAVLPPDLRASFGDAAVYAEPLHAMAVVQRLYRDREAYLEQSRRGRQWVRERHGRETHVRRVRELLPGPPPAPRAEGRGAATGTPPHRHTVMFVSSNGAGMGHLTRLLAMARRAGPDIRPLFLSLSQAAPVVQQDGFPYEYFPSRAGLGVTTGEWNRLFRDRFRQALVEHRPGAVVFDGTWPYAGMIETRPEFPDTRFVWSRRAMWKASTPPDQLRKSAVFDLVVEPGELAADLDRGPTTTRDDACRVRPVTYLDPSDLLPRDAAAAHLGLDPARETALVTLGAGNINDLSSDLEVVLRALRERPAVQVVTTQPAIAAAAHDLGDDVARISVYPLSRYLRAFDAAVAAAGYNSFHELTAFAVPTLFVPNTCTRTDDQVARARYAAREGIGLAVEEVTPDTVTPEVRRLLDPHERAGMRQRCIAHYPGNGAADAMRLVEDLLSRRSAG